MKVRRTVEKLGKELGECPTIMVLLTASGRMVEADDDIHNVDLYPEAVRAIDKLRPGRAPHRVVEYVPRTVLDAMRAERDEALSALREAREIAERNARDCAHLRQTAVTLENALHHPANCGIHDNGRCTCGKKKKKKKKK